MYVYMFMYVCVYVSELVVITSSSVSLVFTLNISFQNKEEIFQFCKYEQFYDD